MCVCTCEVREECDDLILTDLLLLLTDVMCGWEAVYTAIQRIVRKWGLWLISLITVVNISMRGFGKADVTTGWMTGRCGKSSFFVFCVLWECAYGRTDVFDR